MTEATERARADALEARLNRLIERVEEVWVSLVPEETGIVPVEVEDAIINLQSALREARSAKEPKP